MGAASFQASRFAAVYWLRSIMSLLPPVYDLLARAGRDCQRNAVWCRCGSMPGVPESTLTEAADLRRVIKTLSRVTPWRPLYHIVEVWFVIAAAVYASVIFVPPSSGLLGG